MQQYQNLANKHEHSLRSLNLLKPVVAAQRSGSPKLCLLIICILAGKNSTINAPEKASLPSDYTVCPRKLHSPKMLKRKGLTGHRRVLRYAPNDAWR